MSTLHRTGPPETPVRRSGISVRQRAIDELRAGILAFRYRPGERLVERELTESLNISRATLREALGQLRSEGLVELIPQRGAVVATLNRADAADLYEARIRLETLVVERFGQNASPTQLAALADAIEQVADVSAADPTIGELLDAKDRFFTALLEGAGSPVLSQLISGVQARIRVLRASSMSAPGRKEQTVDELRQVLAALDRRDTAKAADLYAQHLRRAAEISLARYEKG